MNTRRGASLGTIVMAIAGLGAAGGVGYCLITGTTPCDIIGACATGTHAGATLPISASVSGADATPSCCELGALAEQTKPASNTGAGEVTPASLEQQADATSAEACAASCCAGGEHG